MLKKVLKIVIPVLLIGLVISQFFSPAINDGDIVEANDLLHIEVASPAVSSIIESACYDCHSNKTTYPTYAKISPVNFWIQGHIDHGKEHLNFSEWASYSPGKRKHKLEECIEELEEGVMPLKSYTWLHSEAKLTDDQKNLVMEWCKSVMAKY